MLIDEIKKANMEALKNHDAAARSALSIAISRYAELSAKGGAKPTDADLVGILKKLDKELDEEKEGYLKAGRPDSAKEIDAQKAAIAKYIPAQLSEAKIREIIASLPDKSLPAVMKHFKTNYAGQVDMGLVARIAREQ
jgi:uncharacterized protein YqeY